jgi:hypothetical protein
MLENAAGTRQSSARFVGLPMLLTHLSIVCDKLPKSHCRKTTTLTANLIDK